MNAAACPRCAAPRLAGPDCPRCGVLYERAARRAAFPEAEPRRPPSAAMVFARSESLDDARRELRLAQLAVPVALVSCWLLVHTQLGHALLRVFCSMWVHELGHAVAAWLCSLPAFPGPWITPVAEERSLAFGLLLAAGAGRMLWRAREDENRTLAAAALAFLAAQLFFGVVLRSHTAHVFVTWAGDGGGMILGAALMATFFVPPDHKLHKDWLRWGFLVIGAAAFADIFHVWWGARSDWSSIPFGEQSNAGPTDPSKLAMWGWTIPTMINRYLATGFASLLVLFVLQFLHVRRSRARLDALER